MDIIAIPAFKDNYIWCIVNPQRKTALIVDPGDAKPVLDFLHQTKLTLTAIFITHHHGDHCGGLKELLTHYPAPVYGPYKENIWGITHPAAEPNQINLADFELNFHVFDTPGHTKGHITYYSRNILFTGDTLFAAGCGRLFEGTATELFASLQKLATLPDDTRIYCAHEYTVANLIFAQTVEPNNPIIAQRLAHTKALREAGKITLPSTLAEERVTNPFLRCHVPDVIHAAQIFAQQPLIDSTAVFAALRTWKNTF